MDRIVVSKYNQIRYLGSILQKNVEIDNDEILTIKARWLKWRSTIKHVMRP
jgi:uncharacterized protein YxjI